MGIGPKKEQIPINIPHEKRAEFDALVSDITKRSQPMRENDRIRTDVIRQTKGIMSIEYAQLLFAGIVDPEDAASHVVAMYPKLIKGDQIRFAIQRALKIMVPETVLENGFNVCFDFSIIDDH